MHQPATGARRNPADDPIDVLVREGGKALALQEGVSFRTLRRRFRHEGMTLLQERQNRRASMVVNLLQLTDLNLGKIALRLGYSGTQSFTKFVHHRFGVPPGILRGQLRQH